MAKKAKSTEVAIVETTLGVSPKKETAISLISPQDLQVQIESETEKRRLITQFIANHLKRGVDFGPIHIAKDCQNKYNCTNSYHFSKDVLFKPGAEKFCSLFKLRAEFKKDTETWEMLGSNAGTVAYICHLYSTGNILAGEGRGVAMVSEKGNPNTAVKIAEKRAKLDAVLSTGSLSDFFTQDLEDMKDLEPEVEDQSEEKNVTDSYILPPKKTEEISDRTKIAHLCRLMAVPSGDMNERIRALTGLEVVEKNFPEIIIRLEMIYKERQEAKK